jgi:hypothetical protein
MSKIMALAATAAAITLAAPATAAIIISPSPGAVQPSENVLTDTNMTGQTTVLGTTNQTNTSVSVQSLNGELLRTDMSNGQSRFASTDDSLDFARIFLTQGGSFTQAEFNLFGATGASSVDITVAGIINGVAGTTTQTFALTNGENFFGFNATGGDLISSITFNTSATLASGGVTDLRQLRVGGVSAVPEPTTWAMMLIGFGAVGYSMRRRKVGYAGMRTQAV